MNDEMTWVVEPLTTGTEGEEPTLVMIAGPELGRHVALDQSALTFGRGAECGLVVQMPGVSRLHCEFVRKGDEVFVRDLGSTNGTFVNQQRLEAGDAVRLEAGDLVQTGGVAFKLINGSTLERDYHAAVYAMMFLDGPTGARNRRCLMDLLAREIPRCQRHARPLSLVMLDVDHFKQINDDVGHLAGDAVLRELVDRVRAITRKDNEIARFGGDEFVIVMPETGAEGARVYAERLRAAVAERPFASEERPIAVTVSIGVAQWADEHTTAERFLEAVDQQLYASKRAGRDCVR